MSAARDPLDPANWAPIDDRARDGRSHLVRAGDRFALVRWNGDGFVFPMSDRPLDCEPDTYFVREHG